MIDESTVWLIHADIDGRLREGSRAELGRILLADPEARALHRDMQLLRRQLEAVGCEEPPAGLADSILCAIPESAPDAGTRDASRSWRYALALVAAVAVVAVALQFGGPGEGIDGMSAVGTIAAGGRADASVALDHPEVRGSVQLRRNAGTVLIDLDVALHHDVEVTAARAGNSASARIWAGAGGERQRLTLELPAGAVGPVSVRLTSDGRLIQEVWLDAPTGR